MLQLHVSLFRNNTDSSEGPAECNSKCTRELFQNIQRMLFTMGCQRIMLQQTPCNPCCPQCCCLLLYCCLFCVFRVLQACTGAVTARAVRRGKACLPAAAVQRPNLLQGLGQLCTNGAKSSTHTGPTEVRNSSSPTQYSPCLLVFFVLGRMQQQLQANKVQKKQHNNFTNTSRRSLFALLQCGLIPALPTLPFLYCSAHIVLRVIGV
jgi:hypothetical protein